jgi:hypothetical protein
MFKSLKIHPEMCILKLFGYTLCAAFESDIYRKQKEYCPKWDNLKII